MSTEKFAVTGDLHLAPNAWVKHPTLCDDAYDSFGQITQYCCERRLPLLILGDIFDKAKPDSHSVTFFSNCMDAFRTERISVYYVQGDHDYAGEHPWAGVHAWPTHVHKQSFMIGGMRMYGLDWTPRANTEEELALIPGNHDALATHLAWSEVQGIGNTDADISMVYSVDKILSGDYHVHGGFSGTNAQGVPTRVWSPGSTCMQATDEPSDKYFFTAIQEDDGMWRFEDTPLITRSFHLADIWDSTDLDTFVGELRDDSLGLLPEDPQRRKPLVRVKFNAARPEAISRIREAAGDRYHLFEEPQYDDDEEVIDLETAPEGAFDSLLTAIQELAANRPELYNDLSRLLRSNDKEAELDAMYEEFKAETQASAGNETCAASN